MSQNLNKQRVYLAGICSLIVTVGVARFAYTPVLPVMQNELGLSDVVGGWLATANYLGYLVGVITAASLNQLRHKYQLHRCYVLLSILTTLAMATTSDPILWAVLRFVAGVCASGGLIIASGLILKWMVDNGYRGELGIHFAGVGIGIVLVALIVEGLLTLSASWQQQWLAFTALAILFAWPAWAWMPCPPAQASVTDTEKSPAPNRLFLRLLMAAYFCAGYGYVVSATFIVDIIEGFETLQGRGPMVFVIVGLSATPAVLLWDRVARRLGQLNALLLAYVLQSIGILLPAISASLTAAILSAILYGGTFVACVSLVLTMAGQLHPQNPAKIMGKMTAAYGIAQIIAPALTGYLASSAGNYSLGLIISATVLMLGAGFVFVLTKTVMFEKNR